MWLFGKGEKCGFCLVIGCRISSFHQKFSRKILFLNFKAPKVPLFRRMRARSEKQNSRFFIELQLCFTDYVRMWRNKVNFIALKSINRNFRANFW